jgi:hypothetical protein
MDYSLEITYKLKLLYTFYGHIHEFRLNITPYIQLSPSWKADIPSAVIKILDIFSNPGRSLPCSQNLTNGLYPEPDESNPHLHITFL